MSETSFTAVHRAMPTCMPKIACSVGVRISSEPGRTGLLPLGIYRSLYAGSNPAACNNACRQRLGMIDCRKTAESCVKAQRPVYSKTAIARPEPKGNFPGGRGSVTSALPGQGYRLPPSCARSERFPPVTSACSTVRPPMFTCAIELANTFGRLYIE